MAIIGVSGRIGSGKDLIGKIIQHITYNKYMEQNNIFEDRFPLPYIPNQWLIKKYADSLKEIASILTGIPRADFEKQEVKDSYLPKCWNRFYFKGAYKGMENLYNKKITPYFNTANEAYAYKDSHKPFSLSLSKSLLTEERMTVRMLLQELGTDAVRFNIHPNAWVNALMSDYKPLFNSIKTMDMDSDFNEIEGTEKFRPSTNSIADINLARGIEHREGTKELPNWIITDVRFPNELKAIEDRSGIVIRVNREINEKIDKAIYPNRTEHSSETALDNHSFNIIIDNNDTIEELVKKVKVILIENKLL